MNVYECTLVIADGIAETQAVGAAIELQVERIIGTQAATSGGVSDGDKGDITVSASGTAWTIDNGVVSTAKLADRSVTAAKLFEVGHEKLIGRHGAGAGDAQEIGIGGGLELQGGNIQRAALTGDVTASAGDNATTLANSGVTAATYGSASAIPVITVDAKGRITSATTATPSSGVMKPRWNSTFTPGSTTTAIPLDNTIPQVGEGGEMIRVASVAPSSTSNSVEITVSAHIAAANTSYIGVALFLGSDTSATATRYVTVPATYGYSLVATFIVPAWSGAKDAAVRVGPNTGGVSVYWGQGTAGSVYGGTLQTSIIVRELEA